MPSLIEGIFGVQGVVSKDDVPSFRERQVARFRDDTQRRHDLLAHVWIDDVEDVKVAAEEGGGRHRFAFVRQADRPLTDEIGTLQHDDLRRRRPAGLDLADFSQVYDRLPQLPAGSIVVNRVHDVEQATIVGPRRDDGRHPQWHGPTARFSQAEVRVRFRLRCVGRMAHSIAKQDADRFDIVVRGRSRRHYGDREQRRAEQSPQQDHGDPLADARDSHTRFALPPSTDQGRLALWLRPARVPHLRAVLAFGETSWNASTRRAGSRNLPRPAFAARPYRGNMSQHVKG